MDDAGSRPVEGFMGQDMGKLGVQGYASGIVDSETTKRIRHKAGNQEVPESETHLAFIRINTIVLVRVTCSLKGLTPLLPHYLMYS